MALCVLITVTVEPGAFPTHAVDGGGVTVAVVVRITVSVVTLPATVVVVVLVTVYVVCVYVDVTAATCAAGVAATSRFLVG